MESFNDFYSACLNYRTYTVLPPDNSNNDERRLDSDSQ